MWARSKAEIHFAEASRSQLDDDRVIQHYYNGRAGEGPQGRPQTAFYGIAFCLLDRLGGTNVQNYADISQSNLLFIECKVKFSFQKKLIHRDIKPSNFVLGRARATVTARGPSKLFIVDFGLSKRWERMKREWGLNMVGTKKYMSEHVMAGDRPHVRDDLISCCYVLREMLDGCLPWDEMVHEQDDMRNWVGFIAKNIHIY